VVLVWIGFISLIFCFLALDLGVFHRKAHVVTAREGLAWSVVWMALALAFGGFVYGAYEHQWLGLGIHPDPVERTLQFPHGIPNDGEAALLKYLTGYVVEQSLSADNMFVIAMIFRFFAVPLAYQHRVLFWGILGALSMRGAMILLGAKLVADYNWVLYLFGGFLILTAVKMLLMDSEPGDPRNNFLIRTTRRLFAVTKRFHGEKFLVRRRGAIILTPLALALVMVEATDVLFAVDSIPAIFAITADPFLVFASNAFAILGLRSLYFVLAGALDRFRYLKTSLAVVLALVGTKMLAHVWLKQVLGEHYTLYVLGAVVLVLSAGATASLLFPERRARDQEVLERDARNEP
jgi:tellurite resistance protein TerC